MGKVIHNFKRFLASRKGQIMFNVIYSWGAAVVILGVMFKIMHFPGGDWILMGGMIVEILVFFAAGLDYSSYDVPKSDTGNGGIIVGGGVAGGSAVGSDVEMTTSNKERRGKVDGSGSVVVIGGGSGIVGGTSQSQVSSNSGGSVPLSSGVSSNVSGGQLTPPDYSQSLSDTAQNLSDFSNTIQSLNEASQKMLDAYKQITETQGFADNLSTLNQNVKGLNDVFNGQLQTITEQMSAIRYINDSLQRMKGLYDGAIGDSYMFREESAKMTKHIEALNNVYARLLQAMTTNNNNNMNQNNF